MEDLEIETAIAPPSADDMEAITAVARDYVEGYFNGDETRMRRCLHPELVSGRSGMTRRAGTGSSVVPRTRRR
jgi:Putative lumazine-binding